MLYNLQKNLSVWLKARKGKKIILPILMGVSAFLLIYGITPLNVTNDSWIMAGYDETDIIQHYSGWIAFRNSEWKFPLGMAADMACEDGTYISFTDSIPWVAVIFKILGNILPDDFQYFGIYVLICYILQGIAAFQIIFYKSRSIPYSSIGAAFFILSPILLERAFRHTALGSQWLILFSILIYIMHRDFPRKIHYAGYLLLLVLAIGIHPYFLPAIAVFLLASTVEDVQRKKFLPIIFFVADLVITYLGGCLIGILGTGVSPSRTRYGFFSLNLNAVMNPTSCGNYTWSSFIKVFPQILGNYDGFNYLGAGILVGMFLLIVLKLTSATKKQLLSWMKKNAVILFLLVCCFLFAVTNVVSFNDKILFEFPLPGWLAYLCGIFRASSRIFYPVYYSIFTIMILGLWTLREKLSEKRICLILGLILGVQIIDIHTCILEKHENMQANASYVSVLADQNLTDILKENQYVVLDHYSGDIKSLAVVSLKNHLKLYFTTANSGNYEKTYTKSNAIVNAARETGELMPYVIVTSDPSVAEIYLQYDNVECYNNDKTFYLYSS